MFSIKEQESAVIIMHNMSTACRGYMFGETSKRLDIMRKRILRLVM